MTERIVLDANAATAGVGWHNLVIPPWANMMHYIIWGGGGNGGNGATGANSAAAGGGGGGSSGQTSGVLPIAILPKQLYVSVGMQGIATRISIAPDTVANHCIALVNAGSTGGSAAGATAGAAGVAVAASTAANMPLGFLGFVSVLGGQAGVIGGVAVSGADLSFPVTGLLVTGGTGGGGLPAAAAVGTRGGSLNAVAGGIYPSLAGGDSATAATIPGGNGSNGLLTFNDFDFATGGMGGASTHGSATGTGLVAGLGGFGGFGCGGGGGGGGLTGSTAGLGGRGGNGRAIITFW
jgi:hypothetical protein